MDPESPPAAPACPHCGQANADGARFCRACGRSFGGALAIVPQPEQRSLLLAKAPPAAEVRRLRACLEHLRQSKFAWFCGEILWPDAQNADLQQRLPIGVVPLGELFGPAGWPADHGWRLRLIDDLASAIDGLHARDCLLNSLSLSSILVRKQTLQFAGLCLGCCLTWSGSESSGPLAGINGSFAAPEVQGFTEAAVGAAADVYLLGPLAHCLLTGRRPRDLMSCEFSPLTPDDGLGPAASEALADVLSLRPDARPESAAAFSRSLRRALLLDAGRGGFAFRCSAGSDVGLGGRPINEDACAAWTTSAACHGGVSRAAAFAVSDGIGGCALGERASAFCVAGLLDEMHSGPTLLGAALSAPEHAARACADWVDLLNDSMTASSRKLTPDDEMGATLTVVLFFGRRAFLVHAGDSLAFLVRDGLVRKLTQDQTYAAELVAQGRLRPEDAAKSPHKNVLVSHVGSPRCVPQVEALDVRPGDLFVLCSDGLAEGLSPEQMAGVLARTAPERAAAALVSLALENLTAAQSGSGLPLASDNVTAVVVAVLDPDPPASDAERSRP
jgi:serine/threonine protein phosphatase PrpC